MPESRRRRGGLTGAVNAGSDTGTAVSEWTIDDDHSDAHGTFIGRFSGATAAHADEARSAGSIDGPDYAGLLRHRR